MATALCQVVVVAISGSVALLADTIHNFGDAATAIPLGIAFLFARRKPSRRFTFGYGRALSSPRALLRAAGRHSIRYDGRGAVRRRCNRLRARNTHHDGCEPAGRRPSEAWHRVSSGCSSTGHWRTRSPAICGDTPSCNGRIPFCKSAPRSSTCTIAAGRGITCTRRRGRRLNVCWCRRE